MVLLRPDENPGSSDANGAQSSIGVKTPKRVLHFSDGVLEEYSTDEEDAVPPPEIAVQDPGTLTWRAWFWYKMWSTGSTTLTAIDTVGGFLAHIFGITTPRYYFELEEYKRRDEMKKKQEEEEKGWSKPPGASVPLTEITTSEPQPVMV